MKPTELISKSGIQITRLQKMEENEEIKNEQNKKIKDLNDEKKNYLVFLDELSVKNCFLYQFSYHLTLLSNDCSSL